MALSKIIGIGGVTNGGKTTVCRMLKKALQEKCINVTHFNMDDYYWEEDDPNHVPLKEFDNYANWDDVCAVNWSRLITEIHEWKNRVTPGDEQRVLLVEGIMIFNHSALLPYFDKKYFFTLPHDECWERRRLRTYLPPEPEGYFEKIAWPYYLKFKEELATHPDIVYVDGIQSIEQNFNKLLQDMNGLTQ